MNDETATIRQLIDGRNAALAAGDGDGVLAPLTDDAVAYNLQPPLAFAGPDARDTDGMRDWISTWAAAPSVELRDPTILRDGDLAVAFGLSHMRGTKRDGEEVDLWYRTTIALQRRAGDWRVVHEHESVPMLMDGSMKAAVDLKP